MSTNRMRLGNRRRLLAATALGLALAGCAASGDTAGAVAVQVTTTATATATETAPPVTKTKTETATATVTSTDADMEALAMCLVDLGSQLNDSIVNLTSAYESALGAAVAIAGDDAVTGKRLLDDANAAFEDFTSGYQTATAKSAECSAIVS